MKPARYLKVLMRQMSGFNHPLQQPTGQHHAPWWCLLDDTLSTNLSPSPLDRVSGRSLCGVHLSLAPSCRELSISWTGCVWEVFEGCTCPWPLPVRLSPLPGHVFLPACSALPAQKSNQISWLQTETRRTNKTFCLLSGCFVRCWIFGDSNRRLTDVLYIRCCYELLLLTFLLICIYCPIPTSLH